MPVRWSNTATACTTAPNANATARNGVCESGEFCLYYNSGNAGSRVDLVNSQRDYGTGYGRSTSGYAREGYTTAWRPGMLRIR